MEGLDGNRGFWTVSLCFQVLVHSSCLVSLFTHEPSLLQQPSTGPLLACTTLRIWLPCSEHKAPSRRPSISSPHLKDCRFGWTLLQSHPQDPSLLSQLQHHGLMPQSMWQAAAGTILEARMELYGSVILSTTRAGCWPQSTLSCY